MNSSLFEIQRSHIVSQLVDDANDSNSYLDLDFLTRVLNEEEVGGRLGFPFFLRPPVDGRPDRKIGDRERINIRQFNDTINTINTDVNTIVDTVGMLDNKISMVNRAIDRTAGMAKAAVDFADMKYREHRRQVGIYRFTHREGVSDISNFDLENSNVDIDTKRHIIEAKRSNLFDGNIRVGLLSSENLEAITDEPGGLAVEANFYKIYIPDNKETATITIEKDRRGETTAIVAATFTEIYNMVINTIVISTAHNVPTKTFIDIVSGKETINVVNGELLLNSIYTFHFPDVKVDKIVITMTQNMESNIVDNRRIYPFRINFISPEFANYAADATFVTKPISTLFPITDISIESTDDRPLGTDLSYFISKDADNWIPITAKNVAPNAPNTIVNIGTTAIESIEYLESTDIYPWSNLTPYDDFGNSTLYNIIEHSDSSYVVSGILDIHQNPIDDEIVNDSIKIYRGIDDWSAERLKYEVEVDVDDILYRFKPAAPVGDISDTDYTHDIISTDAFVRIENEGHVVNALGKIETTYPICNNNLTVVDVEKNQKVNVSSYTNKTISLSGASTSTQVVVTYHSLISAIEQADGVIIEVDTTTFKFKYNNMDADYGQGNDLYYSPIDKKVYVDINNRLPTNDQGWLSAYITFTYKKKSKEEYDVFRTHVYYETKTTLEISPFTYEEISHGNFHIIDGRSISSVTSLEIEGGWHEIITTQPYKNDPDNALDVNTLTNKPSNAAIMLGTFVERRAYKNPMRLVTTHILSNIMAPRDHDAFAYYEGKIYTNFIPEYLPDNTAVDATHLIGSDILAKEAQYYDDGKKTFNQYVLKPEKFLIEYKTRPKTGSDSDIRQLYVKCDLKTNKQNHTSPIIFKFDVLFY